MSGKSPEFGAPGFALPVSIFLVSRVALGLIARFASRLLTPIHTNRTFLPRTDPLAHFWPWTSPWFRFDARWYVDVAEHGYRYGAIAKTNTNFYPLYPLLIRGFQPLMLNSPWIAAWLVANLAFLGALILAWQWAARRWSREVAIRTLLLLVAFPFSFFFMAPYAEPLFLGLAVATFLFAEEERWPLAVAAAGLSTIARPVGIVLPLAVALLAWKQGKRSVAAWALAGYLPFLAFVAYLGIATGHPLGFTVYHTYGWVAPHGGLWTTIASQFHTKLSPFDRIDAAVAAIFLLSAVPVWRRLGAAYALYVLAGVLLPLTRSLAGLERYVIVLFPAMAAWATWRNKIAQALIFSISLFLLVIATTMFADGYSIF